MAHCWKLRKPSTFFWYFSFYCFLNFLLPLHVPPNSLPVIPRHICLFCYSVYQMSLHLFLPPTSLISFIHSPALHSLVNPCKCTSPTVHEDLMCLQLFMKFINQTIKCIISWVRELVCISWKFQGRSIHDIRNNDV